MFLVFFDLGNSGRGTVGAGCEKELGALWSDRTDKVRRCGGDLAGGKCREACMASSVAIAGRIFANLGQLLTVESVLRKYRIAVKFCTALAEQARNLRLAACICEWENMNALAA